MSSEAAERSVYEICGAEFFVKLVDAFYDGVEQDQILISMYPEGSDTVEARKRLTMFLAQYWGGPHDYMEQRGHPMLRMRHGGFSIGALERDRWLMHMATAIEQTLPLVADSDREFVTQQLANYMVNAAEHLRNS
jgi:hemoglobin